MKNRFFICCFLIISVSIKSQENKVSIDAIQNTIQHYYEGYIHRDLSKLTKVFDLKYGTMKVPIMKDNKLIGFKNRYFKEVIPK